jgi:hypothetical protein
MVTHKDDPFTDWRPQHWTYCGAECAYRTVLPGAKVCDHNGKDAVVGDNKVWLPFSTQCHPPGHPLHRADRVSIAERAALLASLVANPVKYVSRVLTSCKCSYVLPLASELSLISPPVVPPWVRRFVDPRANKPRPMTEWSTFANAIASLAKGLRAMHARGIVHGDPFLFNAIWDAADYACWVDLGEIAPYDDTGEALDVFVFWQFGLLALLPGTEAPRAAIDHLRRLAKSPDADKLAGLEQLNSFNAKCSPVAIEEALELSALSLRANPTHCTVAARALSVYYRAFRWNEAAAIRFDQQRALEQARHRIAEREMQRILQLDNNREVARLQRQLNDVLKERDDRLAYIETLENKFEKLHQEHQDRATYISELELRIEASAKEHQARAAYLSELESRIESTAKEYLARGAYLSELESRIEASAKELQARGAYLTELESRIEALAMQRREQQDYIKNIEKSLHEARQVAIERGNYIAHLERNLAAVADNNDKRGAYIDELERKLKLRT